MTAEALGGYLLELGVALLAWRLTRRGRPYHRPAAIYLSGLAGGDLVRGLLAATVLAHPGPYTGAARLAFNVEEALFLFTALGLGWFALAVYWPRHTQARLRYLGVAVFAVAVIAVAYPQLRGAALTRVYLGIALAAEAVVWSAAILWRRRHRGEWPSLPHQLVLIYAAAEAIVLLGPYTRPDLFAAWPITWGTYALLQAVVLVLQGLQAGYPPPAVGKPTVVITGAGDPGASPGAGRVVIR